MSERIAKPSPDAPLYRKGQVTHLPAAAKLAATAAGKAATAAQRRAATAPTAAAMPAQPAVNAWQRPLTAAVQFEGALPPLPPPPPPPPPKHMAVGGLQASLAAGAVTVLEQPLLKMELPPSQQQHSDTPLLSLGLAASIVTGGGGGGGAGAGDGLGWSLIGSAFDLGRGRGGGGGTRGRGRGGWLRGRGRGRGRGAVGTFIRGVLRCPLGAVGGCEERRETLQTPTAVAGVVVEWG